MKKIIWLEPGWTEYQEWFETDPKKVKKINALIKNIMQNGLNDGIGKPEQLKGDLSDWYSRRIDKKDRLVYRADEDDEEILIISSCKTHYKEK